METVGKRIRYARKINQLTLTEVKILTGLSTGNLSDLENDKFMPSANALISFREVFKIHIDWILTGESPMNLSKGDTVKEAPSLYLTEEEKAFIETYRTLDEEKRRDIQGFIKVSLS
ncbi:MAG: helix-turn-helix transcriptional regulator [Clostridia bacterium]|nr:helix-turn-helix transcriptional regulator [Clostridia bacterium]